MTACQKGHGQIRVPASSQGTNGPNTKTGFALHVPSPCGPQSAFGQCFWLGTRALGAQRSHPYRRSGSLVMWSRHFCSMSVCGRAERSQLIVVCTYWLVAFLSLLKLMSTDVYTHIYRERERFKQNERDMCTLLDFHTDIYLHTHVFMSEYSPNTFLPIS